MFWAEKAQSSDDRVYVQFVQFTANKFQRQTLTLQTGQPGEEENLLVRALMLAVTMKTKVRRTLYATW